MAKNIELQKDISILCNLLEGSEDIQFMTKLSEIIAYQNGVEILEHFFQKYGKDFFDHYWPKEVFHDFILCLEKLQNSSYPGRELLNSILENHTSEFLDSYYFLDTESQILFINNVFKWSNKGYLWSFLNKCGSKFLEKTSLYNDDVSQTLINNLLRITQSTDQDDILSLFIYLSQHGDLLLSNIYSSESKDLVDGLSDINSYRIYDKSIILPNILKFLSKHEEQLLKNFVYIEKSIEQIRLHTSTNDFLQALTHSQISKNIAVEGIVQSAYNDPFGRYSKIYNQFFSPLVSDEEESEFSFMELSKSNLLSADRIDFVKAIEEKLLYVLQKNPTLNNILDYAQRNIPNIIFYQGGICRTPGETFHPRQCIKIFLKENIRDEFVLNGLTQTLLHELCHWFADDHFNNQGLPIDYYDSDAAEKLYTSLETLNDQLANHLTQKTQLLSDAFNDLADHTIDKESGYSENIEYMMNAVLYCLRPNPLNSYDKRHQARELIPHSIGYLVEQILTPDIDENPCDIRDAFIKISGLDAQTEDVI